jgi:O-acetyl-ADP-ribose deacetylase (regulator of RNase III)
MTDDAGLPTTLHLGNAELDLAHGDITTFKADAIVNAANVSLAGGGGVDGAIHRAGGRSIMAELRERYPNGTPTGTAVVTTAGDLPATWVIHAVGPRYRDGAHGEADQLRAAYESAMVLAAGLGARTVALPAISAGIYGYPIDDAARIAVTTVRDRLAKGETIERATFVLFSDETYEAFRRALAEIDGPTSAA